MKNKKKKNNWKWVPEYEGRYKISRTGKVKSYYKNEKGYLLKQTFDKDGYKTVGLRKNKRGKTFKVHRLVLFAFVGNPEKGQECRHLDGNPANNNINNLKWGTPKENAADTQRHGKHKPGDTIANLETAEAIINDYINGKTQRELAEDYCISSSSVSQIINKRGAYKDLKCQKVKRCHRKVGIKILLTKK